MLAWGYLRVGRYSEARQLLDELLPKQLDLMGPSSMDTLATRVVIARLLWFTQNPDAHNYCREIADAIIQAYGDGHFLLDDLRGLDSSAQESVRASKPGERQSVCTGAT
jgi:hypothetical protein